jgi:hypothetical protein
VDIVLGVSMTPTTVRMVLVEGDRADGNTVDHDVFDITGADGAANSNASDQVIAAILGTQQSALAGGHRLITTGVTWGDHDEAAALREGLAARGIEDVTLVSNLHAAGALAQAAGRAIGYDRTALMFVERDTATVSVVQTDDGSIVKVLSRSLHSEDAMAVLAGMVTSLEAQNVRPEGVFVVGSGVDVTSVKEHLEHLVSVPVSAPDDSEMALARGAALAAARSPRFEASTVGLAYSQDHDGPDPAFAVTQVRAVRAPAPVVDDDGAAVADEGRRPFMLVGSTLTSIFIVGVVGLVISLAVSIRPTADQRPNPGESIVIPSTSAPVAPPVAAPPTPEQVQPPPVAPAPETIKAPVPVVQEAPQQAPRQVFVDSPPAAAPAPADTPPAPAAPPPEPAAPVPAAPAPVIVPPVILPPIIQLPQIPRRWFPQTPPTTQQQTPPWFPQTPPTTQQQTPPWIPQQPPTTQQQTPPWIPQNPPTTQQQTPPWIPQNPSDDLPKQPVIPPQPNIQLPIPTQQPLIPQLPRQQPSGPRIPFWWQWG